MTEDSQNLGIFLLYTKTNRLIKTTSTALSKIKYDIKVYILEVETDFFKMKMINRVM